MGAFTIGYQNALFEQAWPSARVFVVAVVYAALSLTTGFWAFRKYKPYFAEIA